MKYPVGAVRWVRVTKKITFLRSNQGHQDGDSILSKLL